jgi:glycosyltransferase involved in cell wall biosynthesis
MVEKKVLMACTNYWTSPFKVGSNQIARCFVKYGWRVGWVSDPITPMHVLGKRIGDVRSRLEIYLKGGQCDLGGNLWNYVPGSLISPHNKPLLRSAWVHHNWHKLTMPNMLEKLSKQGFDDVDILYLNSSTYSMLLDDISCNKSILRIADKNIGLNRFTSEMDKIERQVAKKVDLVIYTGKGLGNYVDELKPKASLFLPNGVDFDHFVSSPNKKPDEYSYIPSPIAVYVGAFEDWWFDFELIKYAAKNLPHVSFVLIGPDYLSKGEQSFREITNIYLLGPKAYLDLPPYLKNADIGLMPFPVNEFPELIHHANPIKLYEYLACGLPVVSADSRELQLIDVPISLCESKEEFVSEVQKIVNDPPAKDTLLDYARRQDWQTRFEVLLDKIAEL